jgi:hypothetical protein
MDEVLTMLHKSKQYADDVISKKIKPNAEIGLMLNQCLSSFMQIDRIQIENLIQENYQDLLMITSLSKLTQTQVFLAEKINKML